MKFIVIPPALVAAQEAEREAAKRLRLAAFRRYRDTIAPSDLKRVVMEWQSAMQKLVEEEWAFDRTRREESARV